MATRRKPATKKTHNPGAASNPNAHGAVDVRLHDLDTKRQIRGRTPGDGEGVDIGISPGAFSVSVERHLNAMNPALKKRILDHVKQHTSEAMKPIRRFAEKNDATEHELLLLDNVGMNMFRTIIEFLEEK